MIMASPIVVNEKGFTVLSESPYPTVDIVFVHGFTGHPKDTWTTKTIDRRSIKPLKKSGQDNTGDSTRRSTISTLSSTQSLRSRATLPPNSQASRTATNDISSSDVAKSEGPQRGDVFWPADLVCHTIPNSRVLTYGYDTKVRHWLQGNVSKKSVYDHAGDFLCSLEALRRGEEEKTRPILFIAHSLGGIVVKEALSRSWQCTSLKKHLYGIFEATVGVLFFGTPHKGADPRNFLHHLLTTSFRAIGTQVNSQIRSALIPNNERLEKLKDEFFGMCSERQWQIYSFQEEYGVKALFGRKVVDDDSSCLDCPPFETKQHISNNHMDMCRFTGLHDPEYLKVAAGMEFILGSIAVSSNATISSHLFSPEDETDTAASTAAEVVTMEHKAPTNECQIEIISSTPKNHSVNGDKSARTTYSLDILTRDSLVEQLYFAKIDERLTSLTAAQGPTCRWFLSRSEYISWRQVDQQSKHGGFLWIKGNPGTGKSTLMKLLFEKSKLDAKDDASQITLSFFFLARGAAEEKSTTGLYRSLLHQLFGKAADLKDSLEWMTIDGAKGIQQNGWHEEALKQTLLHAIDKLGTRALTIYVDALDECDSNQASGMIYFLEELCSRATAINVRLLICLSSRHYPTIAIRQGIAITLEDQVEHNEDIRQYIKARFRIGTSTQAKSLQSEILDKSSGIFLWVVIVLDILDIEYPNKSISIKAIRHRLTEIPPRLNELFEMVVTRDADNPELLQICLMWILFATRPLKSQELYFAVQLGIDKGFSTYWDKEDIDTDQLETFVRSASKGLAEVTGTWPRHVQFIHESVRNFLLDRYSNYKFSASSNFPSHGHVTLRDCCQAQLEAYIQQEVEESVVPGLTVSEMAISSQFPFLRYAVLNVLRHANSAQQNGMAQDLFLVEFSRQLRDWVRLHNTLNNENVVRYSGSSSLLYVLASMNLGELIQIHPDRLSCFESRGDRYGPPLFAALTTGCHDAVEAFLSAQIHPSDTELFTLYGKARRKRQEWPDLNQLFFFSPHRGVLSHLAELGNIVLTLTYLRVHSFDEAALQMRDNLYRTPLSYACEKGHENLVSLLLELNDGNTDLEDVDGHTPLLYAAKHGHEPVLRLLLATDQVNVNIKDRLTGRTPLSYTAGRGQEGIVRLLLADKQIDINTKDNQGQTPLSYAAGIGHKVIVELLLATNRIDINPRDCSGQTPFSRAAELGHNGVVCLLLLTGLVDINTQDNDGQTPLSYASERGHEDIVGALLLSGAKVDIRDKYGKTPLSYATGSSRVAIVQLYKSALRHSTSNQS